MNFQLNEINDQSDGWIVAVSKNSKKKTKTCGVDGKSRQYKAAQPADKFHLPYNASLGIIKDQIARHHRKMTVSNTMQALIELSYCKEKKNPQLNAEISSVAKKLLPKLKDGAIALERQSLEDLSNLSKALAELLKEESVDLMSTIIPFLRSKLEAEKKPRLCLLGMIARACARIPVVDEAAKAEVAELLTDICRNVSHQVSAKSVDEYALILTALARNNLRNEEATYFVTKLAENLIMKPKAVLSGRQSYLIPMLLWSFAYLDKLSPELLNGLLPLITPERLDDSNKMQLLQVRGYCNVVHPRVFTEVNWSVRLTSTLDAFQDSLEHCKPRSSRLHLEIASYLERITPVVIEKLVGHCFVDIACDDKLIDVQGPCHKAFQRRDEFKESFLKAGGHKLRTITLEQWKHLKHSMDKITFLKSVLANSRNESSSPLRQSVEAPSKNSQGAIYLDELSSSWKQIKHEITWLRNSVESQQEAIEDFGLLPIPIQSFVPESWEEWYSEEDAEQHVPFAPQQINLRQAYTRLDNTLNNKASEESSDTHILQSAEFLVDSDNSDAEGSDANISGTSSQDSFDFVNENHNVLEEDFTKDVAVQSSSLIGGVMWPAKYLMNTVQSLFSRFRS
ncbi:MAG: hypothetical protein Q8K75_04270 [Chlamydiales bacterium]|nr:hypothetical protein [Chlamydiales bacterium]